jgi:hypothetical protein
MPRDLGYVINYNVPNIMYHLSPYCYLHAEVEVHDVEAENETR